MPMGASSVRVSAMRVTAADEVFDDPVSGLHSDERWLLAKRIVASSGFVRSRLLSQFLLHVVRAVLSETPEKLSEHQIGMAVFGRPRGYRTEDDNIVRNYARQLRRRLTEYFAEEGRDEPLLLEIPTGGYVPQFRPRVEVVMPSLTSDAIPKQPYEAEAVQSAEEEISAPERTGLSTRSSRFRLIAMGCALAVWTLMTAGMTVWLTQQRNHAQEAPHVGSNALPTHALWTLIFAPGTFTNIVPADAGFNLMEDAAQTNIPLSDYMQSVTAQRPLHGMNAQTANDLHTQEFTDFTSAQIAAEFTHLPEYSAQRAALRFPHDLRLDDLRDQNVILIGSQLSNPWSALVDGSLNFRIVPKPGMSGASIMNREPLPGESARYVSRWREARHETWGIVALTRNLSGMGWILLLEGLDVAGTQSAADFVLGSPEMQQVIDKAKLPDGTLRPFEILLRTTSLQSHAAGVTVVAIRMDEAAGGAQRWAQNICELNSASLECESRLALRRLESRSTGTK